MKVLTITQFRLIPASLSKPSGAAGLVAIRHTIHTGRGVMPYGEPSPHPDSCYFRATARKHQGGP